MASSLRPVRAAPPPPVPSSSSASPSSHSAAATAPPSSSSRTERVSNGINDGCKKGASALLAGLSTFSREWHKAEAKPPADKPKSFKEGTKDCTGAVGSGFSAVSQDWKGHSPSSASASPTAAYHSSSSSSYSYLSSSHSISPPSTHPPSTYPPSTYPPSTYPPSTGEGGIPQILIPKRRAPPPPKSPTSTSVGERAAGKWSRLEEECLTAMNVARCDPGALLPLLEQMKSEFRHESDPKMRCMESGVWMVTNEGVAAVEEAIAFVSEQAALAAAGRAQLGPLTLVPGLSAACRDHAADTGPRGLLGHDGSDGSTTAQRIERHGRWLRTCGENIAYGTSTGMTTVLALIVDDGVPSRGHRLNIFNPAFTCVGIASADHAIPNFSPCTVFDFSGGFQPHSL